MKNKETIFENKTATEVIFEGVLFALGTGTALTIAAALITIILNF
tara:strand:+ start:407 stop:541 length:135 start_codon:yes stop_codon:yes gene_type:complete